MYEYKPITNISTNHNITQEELGSYPSEFSDADTCCYYKSVISGKEDKKCVPLKKSNKNTYYTQEEERLKNETQNNNESFVSLSIECDNKSGSSSDSYSNGSDSNSNGSNNNSIWLSLSLTFLFFGLLF